MTPVVIGGATPVHEPKNWALVSDDTLHTDPLDGPFCNHGTGEDR